MVSLKSFLILIVDWILEWEIRGGWHLRRSVHLLQHRPVEVLHHDSRQIGEREKLARKKGHGNRTHARRGQGKWSSWQRWLNGYWFVKSTDGLKKKGNGQIKVYQFQIQNAVPSLPANLNSFITNFISSKIIWTKISFVVKEWEGGRCNLICNILLFRSWWHQTTAEFDSMTSEISHCRVNIEATPTVVARSGHHSGELILTF